MPEELAAMPRNESLEPALAAAVDAGHLLESAAHNISNLLRDAPSPLYEQVVMELVAANAWAELNDRFFRTLAFGTGGLRGRTIGKVVTTAGVSVRGDERDEFLQRQPRHPGTGRLSA
jgi:phosphoglucomutase